MRFSHVVPVVEVESSLGLDKKETLPLQNILKFSNYFLEHINDESKV
jgi:hypothetical protein